MRTARPITGRSNLARGACRALLLALPLWCCEAAPPAAAAVRLADGVLSVDAEHRPLGEVLGQVQHLTGIEMRLAADAAAQPVTAHLARPVADALRALLADVPGSLIERDGAGRVTRVFVLTAGSGAAPPALPPPTPALEQLVKTIPTTPMSADERAALIDGVVSARARDLDPTTRRAQAAARERTVQRVLGVDHGADGLARTLGERLRDAPAAPAADALTPPRSTSAPPR